MPLNLQFGQKPTVGAGLMGLAAGQKEYSIRKEQSERQARQERLNFALKGITIGAGIAQPYVQQAIRQQDRVFNDNQKILHEQAYNKAMVDPDYVKSVADGRRTAEEVRFKAWHEGANNIWEHLKSRGPSEKGLSNVPGWGQKLPYGNGSGDLTQQQMEQAMGSYLQGAGQRAGFDSRAGMSLRERMQPNIERLSDGSMRIYSDRGVQEVEGQVARRKREFREHVISQNRNADSANARAMQGVYTNAVKEGEELFPDSESKNATHDSEGKPYTKVVHFPDGSTKIVPTTAMDSFVNGRMEGFKPYMLKRTKIDWGEGVDTGELADPFSGSNTGTPVGTTAPPPQPQPQPQHQPQPQPQPQPQVNPVGRQIPEPFTGLPPGGRNSQEVVEDQRVAARKSELLQQNLPQLHKMYNSPEMSRKVREMGEKEFFVPEFAKDRALPLREYGFFGPEYKGPVAERSFWEQITFQDPKPHKYDKEELGMALNLIRAVNEREMKLTVTSGGQMNLHKAGGQSAQMHVAREQAARWIADVNNQLDLSQKTWEKEGGWVGPESAERAGPRKGPKWLVGRPIPLPAPVAEMYSQLHGQLEPIGSPHSGRSLGWGSGIPVQ